MLRIPTSLDTPPPLIAARLMTDEFVRAESSRRAKSQRRKKTGSAENLAWEKDRESSRARAAGKQLSGLLWVGGIGVFALVSFGGFFAMSGGVKPVVRSMGQVPELPAEVTNPGKAIVAPPAQRSVAALLSEAEPLARKFMEATTVQELLPLVRNPELAEARMRGFYPGGKIEPLGMQPLGPGAGLSIKDKLIALAVRTRDFEEKALAFIETSQGLKIDWESWVGWSDISWKEFMATKPTTGHVFRVILAPVDYYNFEFTDDQKWQSYRLESPDHEYALYGYVERGTVMNEKIHLDRDTKKMNLMLSLKFPLGASSNNQVEIERFVTEGWVEEDSP
jgi:hypothetical protein